MQKGSSSEHASNCSAICRNRVWLAVVLPTKVADIVRPLGATSETAVWMFLGTHSTKYELLLVWTLTICSSTSFIDIWPLNVVATVKYRPCLGSQAAIMFLASNSCWVNSGTVSALYGMLSLAVRVANPGMRKGSLGNGTMFVGSVLRSESSWPGNLRHVVIPLMAEDTGWFKSPYAGVCSFSGPAGNRCHTRLRCRCKKSRSYFQQVGVLKLWRYKVPRQCRILWVREGTTDNVLIILSGYTLVILSMPEPVPPPREWSTWKPWRQSQPSASLRPTSRVESTSLAPSV